ncbi:MAG: outer membrane protein assembly factor BamA [Candidatus Eisenbacteria sp.]|nr:outer membrane protein assembly factor BamA [Candidatus Eisenbacteria bacterium]
MHATRRWLRLGALGALSLLLFSSGTRARERAEIGTVRYVGLSRVDTALVAEAVSLAAGGLLYPYRVSESVRALYALGLFDQVAVAVTPLGEHRVDLEFRFHERRPVGRVAFTGHDFMSVEDLREHAGLEVGQMLSRPALQRAGRTIEAAYRDEGFAQAQVQTLVGTDSTGQRALIHVEIAEGERVKVRHVSFAGNEVLSDDELSGHVELKSPLPGLLRIFRGGRYTAGLLDEDVARLQEYYRNHGFRDAKVSAAEPIFLPDGRGVDLTFRIEEGPQYRFAQPSWEGAEVFDERMLRAATLFVAGEEYDQSKIDGTLAAVANLYTERGYLTGLQIDPVSQVVDDSVAVTFVVSEGEPSRVGDVRIVGNTTTKERVIRRELILFPGSLLRRSLLLRSQRDVFATGYFEDVQMEFEPGEESDEVDLTFRVKEKSSVMATAGAGYSSQGGLTGFIEFGHNNLFGNGQSVTLKLEHGSQREFYDLSFTEPWVFGRPISVGVDLYRAEYYREIYTGSGENQNYWQKRAGGGVRFGIPWMFRFPDYTRLSLGYSLTDTRYEDIDELEEDTQELLREGSGRLSRAFVTLYRNSTDNPFHPSLGTRTTLRTEFNGGLLGGDLDYVRMTFDHRQYFRPFWTPVVMLRWRAGLLETYHRGGRIEPAERFRLGGVTGLDYLRGYDDYYAVPDENIYTNSAGAEIRFPGGKVMFGVTGELQFPIVDPLRGVIFFDAGETWNSVLDAALNDLRFGTGVGITLEVPMLGPLGLYYAYGNETRKWRTHFAFGTQL